MFQVPSTPDSRRGGGDDHPSTTPAGPPPTGFTHQSFTPAGNPPSSVFGSSFGLNPKPLTFSTFAQPATNSFSKTSIRAPSRGFEVPSSSPPSAVPTDNVNGIRSATKSTVPEIDWNNLGLSAFDATTRFGNSASRIADNEILDFQDSPRAAKRSRNGDARANPMRTSQLLGKGHIRQARMPAIADSLAATLSTPDSLQESDATTLEVEGIMARLDIAAKTAPEDALEQSATQAAQELSTAWFKQISTASIPASIGPADDSAAAQASYAASLLFAIYHPGGAKEAASTRSARHTSLVVRSTTTPVPQSLLCWLKAHHNPFPDDLAEVQAARPSTTAHDRFWDTIFQTLLRGDITTVIQLLSNANWSHADSALEDGYDARGYTGAQLSAVQFVVAQCVELLESCPAVADDDWNVAGMDWQIFRTRTRRAMEELESFAEADGAGRDGNDSVNLFAASAAAKGSFAVGTRRAESRVPWTVYEQLKAIYGQLLGLREEILLSAQDWLEATIYLAVWWDGEEETAGQRSRIGRQRPRTVDIDPVVAYQKRLLDAFASVTDDPEDGMLRVNAVNPTQVALGCVFEGAVEAVLKLLQKWSLLVAASVADVASVAGWMPEGRPRTGNVMDAFDQEDLMVLSHGQVNQKKSLDRDTILVSYADGLARKDTLQGTGGEAPQTGWEVAVRVLSRLDSASTAQQKISDLFASMKFSDATQVDKALSVCNDLGLADQVRDISSRYADTLASSSHAFGPALLYYARAHATDQLQSTVDLLLSTSLVRSASFPAFGDLDPQLEELLRDQATVLARLTCSDHEAARLLAERLSGYATLRRFYDLRDEDALDADDDHAASNQQRAHRSGLRPAARRKEMARGITALIDSAAESIRGGLFDEDVKGVVQVDALLALLGEALPLLTQPSTPAFTRRQILTLLSAAEDLEAVSPRVREQADALFQACMADYHSAGRGGGGTKESQQLARSTSSGGFALVNSKGSLESEKSGKEGAQDEERSPDEGKGWDWRRGVALTIGKAVQGGDVLRLLRVGVAKELARGWAGFQ